MDEVHAELLPGDKVAKVEELLAAQVKRKSLHLWATASMMRLY